DVSSAAITFSTLTTSFKGAISATPPCTYNTDQAQMREYGSDNAKHLSYRHGDKNRINAVFFDGHADSMIAGNMEHPVGSPPSHFTGPAIDPRWYYPTGSSILDPSLLHKNTMTAGLTLP